MQPHLKRNITCMNSCIDPFTQVYNQLEIDSMYEQLNDTRVRGHACHGKWVILLPKYYDQKVALRLELYIVFTTKVSPRVEAWQWMPPPKSWNTKICKRKTFMISHIFFGIKASSLFLNTTPSIFLLLLLYVFLIWFIYIVMIILSGYNTSSPRVNIRGSDLTVLQLCQ